MVTVTMEAEKETAVAAMNTGRNYICFEKDKDIFEIGSKRVTEYSK